MKKIISVVGTRPNFMKVASVYDAFNKYNKIENKIQHLICHTGQHYDDNMSKVFFKDLGLPQPDFYLGVGNGSHAEQTAKIMIEFEKILLKEKPDLIIVVGDVNSTIACSLTAVKLGIKIAHVEAGLRSFDRNMPEEINRVLTDAISDYLFVTENSGIVNLKNEGISDDKIFFVGNCMIDSLINQMEKINSIDIEKIYDLEKNNYAVVTFHRPSNVDDISQLEKIVVLLNEISSKVKVVFPVHPRTLNRLTESSLIQRINKNVLLTEPIGYLEFIALVSKSKLVITDSGGIQEETTYLKIPCITLRTTTERPVTVEYGTNFLVGDDINKALEQFYKIMNGEIKQGKIPELWDGKAGERIVRVIGGW